MKDLNKIMLLLVLLGGVQALVQEKSKLKSLNTSISSLAQCVIDDNNLLLDVETKGDGSIDQDAVGKYKGTGACLKKYGQAVRGTRGAPIC